ncbi:MAG: DNA topoisomerase IB [Bacteroidota bacterium]
MKKKLKHVDDTAMCFSRKKYGKGYQYFDAHGEKIRDKSVLKRLQSLIIPPMWQEVMICKWNDGHIQATGRDLKGRKQYIYHSEWERQRQAEKFAKMEDFGMALPEMREKCLSDIASKQWRKNKVLALLVMILDETGIRIGNQQYAARNSTYGLTTLRRKHLTIDDDSLIFAYKGKSNQFREVQIEDEALVRFIKKSAELPGYEIFRYKDHGGNWQNVDSDEVNAYIRNTMGNDFSSKDFRTWVASRLAVEYYPEAKIIKSDAPRRRFTNILIRLVADELGNTPTVCKSYYVHPKVLEKIEEQELPIVDNSSVVPSSHVLSPAESVLLEVI